MKKSLLIVVDERKMGGVSILLEDMIKLGVFNNFDTDILVLHNNGTMLNNVSDKVNVIYGTSYFDGVDITIKEALKSKNIKLILSKVRLVFDMKTGFIKNKIKKERKKILNKKYDIEIAFKDGFTALFTIFGDSIAKIHWLHYEYGNCNPNQKYDKLFKQIIPKFDKIIAVSEGVKNAFLKIYNVDGVSIIPNIIDAEKIISKSKEKPITEYKNDKINIVLVGRIHEVKGYDRFLSVLSKLKKENLMNDLNINVIGDGPEFENIVNLNKEFDLNVNFFGQVDNPYKEIKNSDLFILPSKFEAFGLVVLESMILHVPVLATKTAATESLIDDGYNGMIVENSAEGIYNCLKYLIQNRNKIQEFKDNLADYCYNPSNPINNIINTLEECYDEKITR